MNITNLSNNLGLGMTALDKRSQLLLQQPEDLQFPTHSKMDINERYARNRLNEYGVQSGEFSISEVALNRGGRDEITLNFGNGIDPDVLNTLTEQGAEIQSSDRDGNVRIGLPESKVESGMKRLATALDQRYGSLSSLRMPKL